MMHMAQPRRTVDKTSAGFGVIKTGAKKPTKLAVSTPNRSMRAALRSIFRTA